MLKELILLLLIIAISIVVVLFMPQAQKLMELLIAGHHWVADVLTQVFTGGAAGDLIRNVLALLAIPVAIAFIPVIFYWITRRSWFPHFMLVVWITWLLETAALVIQYKVA